jgi:hypothetical protein
MRQASPTGGNTINLAAGIYHLTAVEVVSTEGPVGTPLVTKSITIRGAGAGTTVIQRDAGAPDFRLFQVQSGGGILTLIDLTIQGGHIDGTTAPGIRLSGGIGVLNAGILVLTNAEVLNNVCEGIGNGGGGIFSSGDLGILGGRIEGNTTDAVGGGIFNQGTMEISRTTIRNNRAAVAGGGIFSWGSGKILDSSFTADSAFRGGAIDLDITGEVTITGTTIADCGGDYDAAVNVERGTARLNNCTIVGNSQAGVIVEAGVLELRNSILALNVNRFDDPPPERDCFGPVTSLGNNFIGVTTNCVITLLPTDRTGDPKLGPLRDVFRGADGLTTGNWSLMPLPGSPVVDAGDPGSCWPSDQLMRPRNDGNGDGTVVCDMGAMEYVVNHKLPWSDERRDWKLGAMKFAKGGVMRIRRKYTNDGKQPIAHPVFVVTKLTSGFYLLSAERPPGGVGSTQPMRSGPKERDVIAPGESVMVEFRVGLANKEPFEFEVEVAGYPQ